jgi:hypothetical protein
MVLALLREDDMHPYEMIRLMRHRHDDRIVGDQRHDVPHRRASGEVRSARRGRRRPRRQPAGAHDVHLTDAGHEAVQDWVRRELPLLDRPVEFRVALAEAHNLPARTSWRCCRPVGSISPVRDELADGIAHARESKTGPASVIEQYLIEIDRERALLAADHDWLADLLERLAHPDFVWGSHEKTDRYLAQREAARS